MQELIETNKGLYLAELAKECRRADEEECRLSGTPSPFNILKSIHSSKTLKFRVNYLNAIQ